MHMNTHSAPRLATSADREAVEEIVRQAYTPYIARIGQPPGPMLDDYEALIDKEQVWVSPSDGIVQGVVVLVPEKDVMLLANVAVAPSVKGTGMGRLLLEYAEHSARTAGYSAIRLYTHERMTENIEMYTRIGYVETHRAEENGLKRVFMTKRLT